MARLAIFSIVVLALAWVTTATSRLATRQTESGKATVYTQNGATGSCGQANPDSAFIVALSETYMTGPKSADCGRQIQVNNTGSDDGVGGAGNTIMVTVADTCPQCGPNDIDLSVGAWNAATNSAPFGTFEVDWVFLT